MRLVIPPPLLVRLREQRAARGADDVEQTHDAFLMHPGMGPALYLTTDGKVLSDSRDWDQSAEIREGSEDDAVAALVIGAENWSLPELLELLPQPAKSASCQVCSGTRWFHFKDYFGKPAKILCPECRGWGLVITKDA